MIGSLGLPEILLILALALIIFGPRKLPSIGKSLGRAMSEFRRASSDIQKTLVEEVEMEDKKDDQQEPPSAG